SVAGHIYPFSAQGKSIPIAASPIMEKLSLAGSTYQVILGHGFNGDARDRFTFSIVKDSGLRHRLGHSRWRHNHSSRFLDFIDLGRIHVVAMDIGDHDNISFRETRVIALTPGVDVDDLALKLQHQAGVFDGCNLEST